MTDNERAIASQELHKLADDIERISQRVGSPIDDGATADYWRGADDATKYLIHRIRGHADFLSVGHDD